MPSSHRRVGLVLDAPMSSALAILREHSEPRAPEARLARKAVLDGVAFHAVLREAERAPSHTRAPAVLQGLRDLLAASSLPLEVKGPALEEIERAGRRAETVDRRQRQLAMLDAPNPHGRAAIEVTDSLDALDQQLP